MDSLLPQLITISLFLSLAQSFNIEAQDPTIIPGDAQSYFGYQVLQYGPEDARRLMISAPLERHGNVTGAVHKCDAGSGLCTHLRIPEPPNSQLKGIGLSLTANPSSPSELLMCAPAFSYSCNVNTFVNGICYQFGNSLNPTQNITPAFQSCPKTTLDVAFLIDGSGSIVKPDFELMKDFMKKVIKLFAGKDVLFSISQFSMDAETEFDFSEYSRNSDWSQLIDRIRQMSSVTFTPTGIKHVTDKVFTPSSGARDGANRVMIVITDGESNDIDITFQQAIEGANRKNILRYAIGVGGAFTSDRATRELETIASPPSKDFVFKASDFKALEGLQDKLKEKIFAIEGTSKTPGESAFKMELAQTGFSSISSRDSITLGSVGAYDWAGAIVDIRGGEERIVNATVSRGMANAYLGYAMVEARRGGQRFLIVGAPRYRHVGRVVTFQQDRKEKDWRVRQNIDGEQIGSYFGMVLCAVGVDGASDTELLLIGAPLYHTARTGGKVTVCSISPQGNISCSTDLRGQQGNVLGRFGSAIATLGDLNGDGFRDVAVGAPLEDGHRGCLYVYHGVKGGIADTYSQRIPGSQTGKELKYFGASVDGRFDLTKDGLIDLVVGARGGAVILRSAPVLSVTMNLTFDPALVPLASFECTVLGHSRNSSINLHICFQLDSPMAKHFSSLNAELNYTLSVDPGRQKNRAEFPNNERSDTWSVRLSLGTNCFSHRMEIQNCVEDYYNPIELTTRYCAEGVPIARLKNLKPTLKERCSSDLLTLLPFEKNCGTDGVCVSDLRLDFNSTGFIVHSGAQFNLTVSLSNMMEDSYRTNVEFQHPLGISFRKVTVLQSDRKIPVACDDTLAHKDFGLTNCRISHPVFPEHTKVLFVLTLDVSNSDDWDHSILVNVTAISENEDTATLGNNRGSLQIPVRYRVNLLVGSSLSTSYVNISLGSQEEKKVIHRFLVKNLSKRPLPVNVTFVAPKRLGHGILWHIPGVVPLQATPNSVHCAVLGEVRGHVIGQVGGSKDCAAETCLVMHCVVDQLTQGVRLTFVLQGDVSLNETTETEVNTYDLQTVGRLTFDEQKYTQGADRVLNDQFLHSNVTTHVEIIRVVNLLPVIAGGAVGGLILLVLVGIILWKAGFFNRKYKDRIEDGDTAAGGDTAESSVPLNAAPPEPPAAAP